MPTILDFQIQPLSAESYSLAVCERSSPQPLASATFSHRVDFLTDFSVDRLNASTKDPAERFDELQKLGRELYQKLFPPAVEQVWNEYKQRSEFLILCLRFAEGAAKLEVLPWETLHDGAEFIAAGARTTLVRLPLDVAPQSELPPIPRPLRLFGFFASPLDLGDHERLNAEREQEILLEAINDPAGQGRISADFEDEAKLEILARSLQDGYHILHFTGHGISPRDGGGLLLEDAHGKKLPASIADVMQAVESGVGVLRLAVISGCQTARTLHAGGFNDLARELLRQRVPAVIAMQFSISDEGGLKFAEVLYKEIAKGVELERAVHAARRVLLEYRSDPPKPSDFRINNDALAIVLLAADGACLQTTETKVAPPQAESGATYLGDRLDPLAHGFYGRRREYRKIRDGLLHQDQRAVIIHGIGGIGKTALLTHAINRLRSRFKDVMSFDCRRAALAPETIMLELSRYFAAQGMPQLQSLIGQTVPPETLADEITKLLTEWPLLIVFDNFESQLDEQREIANVDLRVFLTTLMRATAMGSRFLFTTRYLFNLDGNRLGNLQEMPLGDLSHPEALMLMQKLSNLAQAAYRDKLAVLEKFGAHPYALVTLDRHCSHQPLDQALQDASALEPELREHLAIELNYRRLSDQARELLNRLAAFRSSVPIATAEWVMGERVSAAEILMDIWDEMPDKSGAMDDEASLQQLLQQLSQGPERRRADNIVDCVRELSEWGLLTSQVEDRKLQTLAVHSLVRDFCRDQQSPETWRERLRDAAKFFTNQTQLVEQYNKSAADIWSEMEAFELLMEAGDFAEATFLLTRSHPILDRWGYTIYLKTQYDRMHGKLDDCDGANVMVNLGLLSKNRGNYGVALEQYQESLKIFLKLGDRQGIAISHHNIGMIYQERGDYNAALQEFEQSLKITEELGDRRGIALLHHQIGIICHNQGDYNEALRRYRLSLEIKKEVDDRVGIARSHHQIGMVYQDLGDYDAALDESRLSLKIKNDLNDRAGIAYSLLQIGNLHRLRGDYPAALQQYHSSLEISEELGDQAGIAHSLHVIGIIHQECGNYDEALRQYWRSLKIRKKLRDLAGVAGSRHQIGMIHQARGGYEKALRHYHRSLDIWEKLGDHAGKATLHINIGAIHQDRGDYKEALQHYQSSLKISEELGDQAGIAHSLEAIGIIHRYLGDYDKALQHSRESLKIFEELGDRAGVAGSHHSIGMIHHDIGDHNVALQYYQKALEIFEKLGSRASVARLFNQIGLVHQERGDYDETLQQYQKSLKIFEELGDRAGIARSLHNIGSIHHHYGDYDAALQQYHLSLKITEELGDRDGVAGSLHNIGMIYQECGDNDAALRQYQLSLKIFEELGDRAGIANLLHQIGIIHHDRGNHEVALRQYHRSLEIKEELGDRVGEARLLYQIAKLYHEHKNYEVALRQSQLSLKIFEELGDRAGVATSLSQIGIILGKSRRYTEAFQYFSLALNTYIELQSPDVKGAISNLRNLRAIWGALAFDAAWRKARGEAVPNWLK